MRTLFTIFALCVALAACDDSDSAKKTEDEQNTDDCVSNPTHHAEIINACTNAVRIKKTPVLPKLNPDGTLPPLP